VDPGADAEGMSAPATTARSFPGARVERLPIAAELLSRTVLGLALLAGLAVPEVLSDLGPLLLVTAGLLGLPHGAVDHLAWGWSRGELGRPRVVVVGVYATAALGAVGVALLVPVPALLVLLALSAAHFAEGEVAWSRLRGTPVGWLPGAAAGLSVVTLPVLMRPDAVRPLLRSLDPALPEVLLSPAVRLPLLVLTGLLVLAGVVVARSQAARLGELLLVVAVAATLPPLAAFAAWFAGWHAVRHTARLLLLDPRNTADLGRGDLRTPLSRFARSAALPSAAAVVGTLALGLATGVQGGLLVALLALTVPHTAVVAHLGTLSRARGTPAGPNG